MVRHVGIAPTFSKSQASRISFFLMPDKLADGGGHSPQTSYEEVLPVFKTGHRSAVLHHP
jgi:hypothetical protein